MASGGERAEAPDDPDDEAPLQRARKALVSNAAARRWRAETAAQRQRDYLGELARPGGLRAAVEAIEDSLQGLMDVCGGVMEGQRVYTVEVYADAPMRVRASFESRADAELYCARFGGVGACLISESLGFVGLDAQDIDADAARTAEAHDEAIASLRTQLAEARAALRIKECDYEELEGELDELRAELQERNEKLARIRKEAA